MSRLFGRLLRGGGLALVAGLGLLVVQAAVSLDLPAATKQIKVLPIEESINPGTANFLARGIKQAEDEGAPLVIIQLDTPGGLVTSMRTMVKSIMNSQVPVAVFVGPSGA